MLPTGVRRSSWKALNESLRDSSLEGLPEDLWRVARAAAARLTQVSNLRHKEIGRRERIENRDATWMERWYRYM